MGDVGAKGRRTRKAMLGDAQRIRRIIEAAEYRAMACDGPVGETWHEMSDRERRTVLRAAYRLACKVQQEAADA